MSQYTDKVIVCCDCKDEFILTAGEQRFFNDKGMHEPKRCKPCRDRKRQERSDREGRDQDNYSGRR